MGAGRVAIVGAGTIGGSWARLFVRAGLEVAVCDADPGLARRVAAAAGAEAGGSIAETVAAADWVQESVPETLEAKRAALAEAERHAPAQAILASSASALAPSEIAADLARPGRFLVAHPTNPPHLVPLVELVPGTATAPATLERALAFLRSVGQEPIVVRKEVCGYVLNRLQMALLREAMWLVREGVASVADVDRTVTSGLGLRWAFLGPFGVEETNAASIEDDLRKFGPAMRELMADVGRPFDGPGDEDVALAAAGIAESLGGAGHDDAVAWRDEMVRRLRELKAAHPLAGAVA
jgi:3-hydroxyacyl-CoA dehydrogenase